MAYKYEIEKKASLVKIRVLIAVYVMFVVSSILIGIAVRLQQIQSIRPSDPQASIDQPGFVIGAASDPNYQVRQLGALAYCDVVDANNNPTGVKFPLAARFVFRRIGRNIGQDGTPIATVCTSAVQNCDWKNANDDNYSCRNGQTATQCQAALNACPNADAAIPGSLFYQQKTVNTTVTDYVAQWPGSTGVGDPNNVGILVYDDNEVNVFLNTNAGDLAGNTVVRDGVTYTIDKSALSTIDTSSLFPIFRWQCNNATCRQTSGSCAAGDYSYDANPCTFANNVFSCPQRKFAYYPGLVSQGVDDATFYYTRSNDAGQVAGDPSWIKMGMAYDAFADSTYDAADPFLHTNQNLIDFKGNLAKYRFTCKVVTVTTDTPTVTPSILISATKRGPVCVERVAPANEAPFTITVSNNGDTATVIEAVKDSLPQGFSYKAASTTINGTVVPDTFVTTINSGTSQLVTFAPPSTEPVWSLDVGETLTITFTAIASTTAVTGTNTNSAVVVIGGTDAIDNITYQFPVEQTCNPVTGVFDEPLVVFALSGVFIVFGLYLLYAPGGEKLLNTIGRLPKNIEKSIKNKDSQLRHKADPKTRFEQQVLQNAEKKKQKGTTK